MGQLENSEGHKKINRALTGFFGNRRSSVINSSLQFLMQFELFRDIVLSMKPACKYLDPKFREIEELARIFYEAEEAEYRAIHTDVRIYLTKPGANKNSHQRITRPSGLQEKGPFLVHSSLYDQSA